MSTATKQRRAWKTPFTEAVQCRLPILSAPMAGVAGGLLAAEVTRAGGLGMIAAGHLQSIVDLEMQIEIFEEAMLQNHDGNDVRSPYSDLAIGFIGFSSLALPTGWENYERILRKYKPKAVQFFAPFFVERGHGDANNVQLARSYGSKFIAQVGSMADARLAIEHDVDVIICQGSEAGGHGLRRELGNSAMALTSQTKGMTDIAVLASGGIVNGRHLASVLCYCDGASIGTRYWACKESVGDEIVQGQLADDNSCDDVLRTTVFDTIQNETSTIKWPYPYDSVGSMRNKTTEEWDGRSSSGGDEELRLLMDETDFLERYDNCRRISDISVIPVLSGEGVGEINSIEGAYEITIRIEKEAIDTIDRLWSSHVN
jgi:nitronate monooxygenase